MDSLTPRGIVVISGGTAANSLVDVFSEVSGRRQNPLNYIIGVYGLCSHFDVVTDGLNRSVIMAVRRAKSLECLEVRVLETFEVYFSDLLEGHVSLQRESFNLFDLQRLLMCDRSSRSAHPSQPHPHA